MKINKIKLVFFEKKEHNSVSEGYEKMKVNNSEQKEIDRPEEWSLTKHVSTFINEDTEFKFSRAFGKKQPWIVTGFIIAVYAAVYFIYHLSLAAKTIIREIM